MRDLKRDVPIGTGLLRYATDALLNKTKDLQIAAWLTEALIRIDGFEGLCAGLQILNGFLSNLWEHIYPEKEDNDLDFRIGPIEFMNEKLSFTIRQIPLTDPNKTPGYSLLKFEESRQVGYDKDVINQRGRCERREKERPRRSHRRRENNGRRF